MCHVSRVTCHMSHVTCKKHIKTKNNNKLQSGGASRSRVCYQRGLPRLVLYLYIHIFGQGGEPICWRVCYQQGLPRLVYRLVWVAFFI